MVKEGLVGVTTRKISEAVGCSEGALYVHFKGRLELLLAMLEDSLPEMLGPLRTLQGQVGLGSPQVNLVNALRGIFRFHQRITPRLAALFADPELHAAFRDSLSRQNAGPQRSMGALEDYIAAEQRLGRVDSRVDPKLAAYLLMSSSFFRAFTEQFFGITMRPALGTLVEELVAALVPAADTKAGPL
jgi:AcrR family transcriptional regulator